MAIRVIVIIYVIQIHLVDVILCAIHIFACVKEQIILADNVIASHMYVLQDINIGGKIKWVKLF